MLVTFLIIQHFIKDRPLLEKGQSSSIDDILYNRIFSTLTKRRAKGNSGRDHGAQGGHQ